MNDPLRNLADRHFQECCGLRLDELTAPLGEANPAGPSLRGGPIYHDIAEARREDDPSLPLGPWAYELKRADWGGVIHAAADALANQSKDLQLCAWLMEGAIHHYGLAGFAPAATLTAELCERYWEHLHPAPESAPADGAAIDDDTLEARANLFEWINEKLLPPLRLVPLTRTGQERPALCWADWELAARNEQLRLNNPAEVGETLEGPTLTECHAALTATASEQLLEHHAELTAALAALERLGDTLDALCGDDGPSFSTLRGLLDPMRQLMENELKKRGIAPGAAAWRHAGGQPPEDEEAFADDPDYAADEQAIPRFGALGDIPQGNRAAAYAVLAEVAEQLGRIEPHSPVPALLRRAVEWGTMNTRELYEELFLRLNGQLNIFELLGVEFEGEAQQQQQQPGEH